MASFTERLRARGVSDGSPTFTERISKRIEEDRAIQARREKLAQYWGTGISSLNNETTAPTQTAPFKKGASLSEQLTVQNALNTINSPALTASDMVKQMQAANTLADMGYVKKPEPKPTLLQTIGNIISDPLGSVVRGAEKIDEALAKSDNVFARNIAASLGDVSSNLLNAIPGGYDSQSGPAIQIREDAAKAQARGDNTVLGQVIRTIPQTAGALYTSFATGGGKVLPFLWSLGQSYGGAYKEARDQGVDDATAKKAALIQAVPQAAIEVTGGLENIIGKSAGKGLLRTFGRAALEESLEEVFQYPFEGLSKKATYAPETPWFSTKEEAVINPIDMGRNALIGGIAGGLFGGAVGIATQGINLSGSNNISNILSQESVKPGGAGPAIQTQPTAQAQQTQPTTQNQQAQQQTAPTTEAPQQARIFSEEPTGTIPEGMRERGFSRNIRTDEAMPDDIRQMFDEEPLAYKQISNQATLAKAEKIMEQGEEAATAEFYRSIGAKEFKPETVPLAKMLAKQANEAGNVAKAREILSATAERLTEAGQFSQAAKILREADPETFLMTMDKQLKKLNEQGRKKYGKKGKDVDLTSEEIEAIKNIPKGDQQAYDGVWEQIGNRISKELHSSGMEKFNAWRRMAMLLNPRTHIRNVGGNVIMMGMRKAADTIGAALQKAFVPAGQRTQSVGWSFNKDIVAKVNENWDTVKKDILGESRWEIGDINAINREKRIFKKGLLTRAAEAVMGREFDRGFLQWLNDVSLKTLNLEDNIFAKRAYKDALGQYLHANNLDVVTDEAVEYATRRALEATFKQANMLADFINKAKNVPVAGFFVEGAIPFTQTPANIVMRGIEYSPGGIIKALYDIKAGKTAATVIEDLSKGLTGSAIMALGFWLSSIGWAKVNRKRSDKAEALYQELGDQRYAINTPLGSYTFDWAQPFSIPFAMGIAAQEAIRDRKDGDTIIQAVIDGIAAGGDTIFNMTMLQNIREILGSYGSPTEKIMGIPIDYLEQAIASVLGQTARTIDPVRRSTYDPNSIGQWWRGIRARIPGLSQTLEPALNIWGQEQSQGGALQQFISPGYFRARSDDPVTNEMARLYESVNDTSILPKTAPNSFTKDKVEYKLSAQQKTEFARIMGQNNYNDLARLFTSSEYKELTDEQRAKRVKSIVESNYDEAKGIIIGGAK